MVTPFFLFYAYQLMIELSHSPIYLCDDLLYQYRHRYYFILWLISNSIIISLLRLSQLWPLGAPLRCLLYSLTCSHLIFSIFLLSVLTVGSRIILGLPCPFFKICHFSRNSLHWRTVFKHQYWAIIATRPSQQTELEKICINTNPHISVFLYLCVWIYIPMSLHWYLWV